MGTMNRPLRDRVLLFYFLCSIYLLSFVCEDVESRIVIGHVEQAFRIDEHIAGLDDLGAFRPGVKHTLGCGRDEIGYFFGPEGVFHIEYPNAGILIGCEDQFRTLTRDGDLRRQLGCNPWQDPTALFFVDPLDVHWRSLREAPYAIRSPLVMCE